MFNLLSEVNTDTLATGLITVILFILLSVALVPIAVFLIGRYHGVEKENTEKVGKLKTGYLFLIVLAVGLALRLLMTFVVNGYGSEYGRAYALADSVVNNGFSDFAESYAGMMPLTGYITALFGAWGIAAGNGIDDIWMQFFYKLPYLIADVVLFVSIDRIASKQTNRYVGLTLASLYYLSPLSFAMSSMWGSSYTLLVLALFFLFYFLLKKNIFGMTVTSVLACMLHSDAVFMVVIVAVYLVYAFVKAIIKIVKTKPSFNAIFNDASLYNVVYVPLCIALGLVSMYLLCLPAYFPGGVADFGSVYHQMFVKPYLFESGESALYYFSTNGLGIYTVFMQNFAVLGAKFPTVLFASLFVALVAVVVAVIFIRRRNRANIVLLASYASLTVAVYFMGASEWTIVPSLALLLLAFIVVKDRRLLSVYALLSVFVSMNALLVMLGGDQLTATYVSSAFNMTTHAAFNTFSILLSVLTVLVHIYYTVVTLDITLTGRRKEFVTEPSSSFGEVTKRWIRG